MSGILSGAGGASCQLCTANEQKLKDLELVRNEFPINRHIEMQRNCSTTWIEMNFYHFLILIG